MPAVACGAFPQSRSAARPPCGSPSVARLCRRIPTWLRNLLYFAFAFR
ncbi:hypothetical protein BIFBIF_00159 [Bifidobacterium bifidum ATCC 29521 = JCM 1255 = DSM 20456]|nr:hypothetical protein BIFBIF_00159 [Bifidobacterium bifidum ATCC 29521 = JCM 1255 = DSM 20456]